MELVIVVLIVYIIVRELIAYRERVETARIYRMKEMAELDNYEVRNPLVQLADRIPTTKKATKQAIPIEDIDLSKEK